MLTFWNNLPKGFFVLAPMEDVTDTVFREVVVRASDSKILKVLVTEFTSTDGMCSPEGFHKVTQRLEVNDSEIDLLRKNKVKLVAQIWGNNPDKFYKSARYLKSLGIYDGIDINMGCPVKKVVKKQTCSALIQYPELARELVEATKEGGQLPVSVKTRIGFKSIATEEWTEQLLIAKPAALALHGRIQKQMSEGLANWEEIGKAVSLREKISPETIIIGNGDILSYQDGLDKQNISNVDGLMVGRGIFKNIHLFNKSQQIVTPLQQLNVLEMHVRLFEATWGNTKNYQILKRFFKVYINGFAGAAHYRNLFMNTNTYLDAYQLIRNLKPEFENIGKIASGAA